MEEYTELEDVKNGEELKGDDEALTLGDIFDTLSDEQKRKVKILMLQVAQGKTAAKMVHHLKRYGLAKFQFDACKVLLQVTELERLKEERDGSKTGSSSRS